MFEIGRLCIKLAGRDAGMKCVVVEVLDGNYVLVDGLTRRRKCNLKHLEPLAKVINISKGANHKTVIETLNKEGIECKEKKFSEKKVKLDRPRKHKLISNKTPKQAVKKDDNVKVAKKETKPKKETKTVVKEKKEIVVEDKKVETKSAKPSVKSSAKVNKQNN